MLAVQKNFITKFWQSVPLLYQLLIIAELILLLVALAYLATGLLALSHYYPPIHWSPNVS